MTVKVLVANDSAIVRRAIKRFLENVAEITLVGEAESLDEAALKCRELRPDVVVLDLHLAGDSAGSTRLKSMLDGAEVVAITFGADEASKILAQNIEAQKLLDKGNLTEELIPAILGLNPDARVV